MHSPQIACLFAAMFIAGCGRSKPTETLDAVGGQKIVKDYFADGSPKSVTRLRPDGSLLGTLHFSNGVPAHADYFDDQKRVRHTLFYRANGTPFASREFDEQGKMVAEQQFDASGKPVANKTQ